MPKFFNVSLAAILIVLFGHEAEKSYWQGKPLKEAALDNGVRYEMVEDVPDGILVFIRKMDDPDSEPKAFKIPRYYPCGFVKTESDEVMTLRECKPDETDLGYLEPPISITLFDENQMSREKPAP